MNRANQSKMAPPRATYRHGDLRRALIEAGLDLARAGGPDAVVLREATRRAGVVPNAAYRHFANREDLLLAVRAAALALLAEAIEAEHAKLDETQDVEQLARAALRAVGNGYLAFAAAEPGLFRTAFVFPAERIGESNPSKAGATGLNPYQLLGAALDRMVEAGILAQGKRPGAEILAWSAVHGLAMLLLDGPLESLGAEEREAAGRRVIEMVERGL